MCQQALDGAAPAVDSVGVSDARLDQLQAELLEAQTALSSSEAKVGSLLKQLEAMKNMSQANTKKNEQQLAQLRDE
eukprot:CAMPEP_0177674918 /NCGR_PEP_ID=MMETSP0447-20121125/26874_1 /TAXON_ID=0 /ORGANISM="Stygamoeba regulata, Strain BSH-02190019" /LENGTH=75 /DNA_ID=CAMNT_0019183171 /DNA_START=30 /DNA_END=254 /DNA_ORIENTATION=+